MTAKVSKLTEAPTKQARQRLSDAGERLFAEHGWNGVGIRTIAAAADVSLAALNYNFGERENLLARIFAERASPNGGRADAMRLLTEIKASGTVTLERVIEAFLRPAFGAGRRRCSAGRSSPSLAPGSRPRPRHYIAALHTLLPELSAEDLGRRFHFLLSAMVYTMADAGWIESLRWTVRSRQCEGRHVAHRAIRGRRISVCVTIQARSRQTANDVKATDHDSKRDGE
jgi:AcrR family transcriptional regulator